MSSSAFWYVLFAHDQGKYYKKQINTKQFSLTEVAELLKLIKASCMAEAESLSNARPVYMHQLRPTHLASLK